MISGSQTKHIFFFTFLFYLIFFKFNFRGRVSRLLVISCLFVHLFFVSFHLSQTVFRMVYCFKVVLPSVLPTATRPIFFVSNSISVKDFSRNTAGRVYRSITKIGYGKMYRVEESSPAHHSLCLSTFSFYSVTSFQDFSGITAGRLLKFGTNIEYD